VIAYGRGEMYDQKGSRYGKEEENCELAVFECQNVGKVATGT
jgi:hypothetical protein